MADDLHCLCAWCEREIRYGDLTVLINRHVERLERTPEYPDGVADVLEAEGLIVLCIDCGQQLDSSALQRALHSRFARVAGPAS